jgi:hypothetical protein
LPFWSVESLQHRQRLKIRKFFVIRALCTAEIHIALGAFAADCPKGFLFFKRGTEKPPDCFVVTILLLPHLRWQTGKE